MCVREREKERERERERKKCEKIEKGKSDYELSSKSKCELLKK